MKTFMSTTTTQATYKRG